MIFWKQLHAPLATVSGGRAPQVGNHWVRAFTWIV